MSDAVSREMARLRDRLNDPENQEAGKIRAVALLWLHDIEREWNKSSPPGERVSNFTALRDAIEIQEELFLDETDSTNPAGVGPNLWLILEKFHALRYARKSIEQRLRAV